MEIRNAGRSGLKVSSIGLGCNNFGVWLDKASSLKVVEKAMDLGVNVFDTADVYGEDGASEKILGEALKTRRAEAVIVSKTGFAVEESARRASRRSLILACEKSLRHLGTDWIDLYLIHAPDLSTPIEETMRALDDLIHQGKIRYAGCSNFSGWQIADAQWTAKHLGLNAFCVAQDEYSLLERSIEAEKLRAIDNFGLGLMPYFPLASGMLSGKYKSASDFPASARLGTTPALAQRFMTPRNFEVVQRLAAYAVANDRTLLELAVSWLAAQPAVFTVIAGATSPAQIEQNVAAGAWKLSAAQIAEIEQLTH